MSRTRSNIIQQHFDPLSTPALELQTLQEQGKLSAVQIVETYLAQIYKFDQAGPHINALISVAPRHILLAQAIKLDDERAAGKVRSALHGLPIIFKVSMPYEASSRNKIWRLRGRVDLFF